jgi:Glycosyl transferase family 2
VARKLPRLVHVCPQTEELRAARPDDTVPGPRISIIVPAYNDARNLRECLAALRTAATPDSEIIVVDDASTDESAAVAERAGVRVVRLPENSGPAAGRNRGVGKALGEIVFFVDSDVAVAPDAVRRVLAVFDRHPEVAAVFGSYDASPNAPGIVSQYRNLLHHFVHQQGNPEASTFWAGCGAIRRAVFTQVGGFDEGHFRRPAVEDIELGYRLRQAGHRILLDKRLQGTHFKIWTLRSLLITDIMARAVPWSRLILERQISANDLNLKTGQRVSALLVLLGLACLILAPFRPVFLAPAGIAFLAVVGLNRTLYGFFLRHRGMWFAAAAILLHLLYYLYSTISYVSVWLAVHLERRVRGTTS